MDGMVSGVNLNVRNFFLGFSHLKECKLEMKLQEIRG